MSCLQIAAISISLTFTAALLDVSCGSAAEADGSREQGASKQREGREQEEPGRERAMAEPRPELKAMPKRTDRQRRARLPGRDSRFSELQERLFDLKAEAADLHDRRGHEERLHDVRAEAERVRRELAEIALRGGPGGHEPPDVARRMEHMHQAVEHLKRAGMHDIAEHVARRAEDTERSWREQHHRRDREIGELARQVEELRGELGRLRDQVTELLQPRSGDGRLRHRGADQNRPEEDPPRRPRRPRESDPGQSPESRQERNSQPSEN